jgi:hypothetical protein
MARSLVFKCGMIRFSRTAPRRFLFRATNVFISVIHHPQIKSTLKSATRTGARDGTATAQTPLKARVHVQPCSTPVIIKANGICRMPFGPAMAVQLLELDLLSAHVVFQVAAAVCGSQSQ